jgi:hypothetical protein
MKLLKSVARRFIDSIVSPVQSSDPQYELRYAETRGNLRWGACWFHTKPLNEAIQKQLEFDEMGGLIVFSTDVNVHTVKNLFGRLKDWWQTVKNRLGYRSEIERLVRKVGGKGFTIGTSFRGRYFSEQGEIFDEKSLTLEVLYANRQQLIDLATNLCRTFQQETVIVKTYADNQFYIVDKK